MPLDNYNPGPVFDLILRLKAQTNSGTPVVNNTLNLFASNEICSDNDDTLVFSMIMTETVNQLVLVHLVRCVLILVERGLQRMTNWILVVTLAIATIEKLYLYLNKWCTLAQTMIS